VFHVKRFGTIEGRGRSHFQASPQDFFPASVLAVLPSGSRNSVDAKPQDQAAAQNGESEKFSFGHFETGLPPLLGATVAVLGHGIVMSLLRH
jgi:hypothetical protein